MDSDRNCFIMFLISIVFQEKYNNSECIPSGNTYPDLFHYIIQSLFSKIYIALNNNECKLLSTHQRV